MTTDQKLEEQLLHLVRKYNIAEQSQLQDLLKQKGINIPQATLSRRLKKYNIAKISGFYQVLESQTMLKPLVTNIKISEFGLIVLHTQPGNANSLAYYIDQQYVREDSGILGTLAGDDTALLIIKNKKSLKEVLSLLYKEFPYLISNP